MRNISRVLKRHKHVLCSKLKEYYTVIIIINKNEYFAAVSTCFITLKDDKGCLVKEMTAMGVCKVTVLPNYLLDLR